MEGWDKRTERTKRTEQGSGPWAGCKMAAAAAPRRRPLAAVGEETRGVELGWVGLGLVELGWAGLGWAAVLCRAVPP